MLLLRQTRTSFGYLQRQGYKPKPEWSINRAKIDGGLSHAQVKSEKPAELETASVSELTKSSFSIQGNQDRTTK
eukprot:scaffold44332_cov37-Attheya_sp.AAC.2